MTDPKQAKCLDPKWDYTKSESTDIRVLFRRIRKQMKEAEAAKKPASNVKPLKKGKA